MEILQGNKIKEIIRRIAIQIAENNLDDKRVYLAGINNNGYNFAKMLAKEIKQQDHLGVEILRISLDPSNPLGGDISLSMDAKELKNKVIIIVDDVANTGRTIFYAFRPIMEVLAKKVEVAVLVNRKHMAFPIAVDYVGMSLATTMKENIVVELKGVRASRVVLE